MTRDDTSQNGVTIPATGPFELGLGQNGELNIGFSLQGIRAWIVLPAEEVKILAKNLEKYRAVQETLAAKPPKQGAH